MSEEQSDSQFLLQKIPVQRVEINSKTLIAIYTPYGLILFLVGIVLISLTKDDIFIKKEYGIGCNVSEACEVVFNSLPSLQYPFAILFELDGFYQNHFMFMRSRNDGMLKGDYVRYDDMKRCAPYRSLGDDPSPSNWILPCGRQAISVFNDTVYIKNHPYLSNPAYPTTGVLTQTLNGRYLTGYKWMESSYLWSSGQTDPKFAQWMDTAAFSSFRRIWAVATGSGSYKGSNITLVITNNYNASLFNGRKYVIIASNSAYPPETLNLGIVFVVFGVFFQLINGIVYIFRPCTKQSV